MLVSTASFGCVFFLGPEPIQLLWRIFFAANLRFCQFKTALSQGMHSDMCRSKVRF